MVSEPVGVGHVAMVTADLDGFRTFSEETIGLETTIVFGAGPGHARQAVIATGNAMLHVFEVVGYDPAPKGFTAAMFKRGRLDHIGFTVADEAALIALRDRLLAVGASSGGIRRLGPTLSVRFHDPDGLEGEVNCLDPSYDPSTLRDEDEIIDPTWRERTTRVLRSGHALPPSSRRETMTARLLTRMWAGAGEFFTEVDREVSPDDADLGALIGIATAHGLPIPPPPVGGAATANVAVAVGIERGPHRRSEMLGRTRHGGEPAAAP